MTRKKFQLETTTVALPNFCLQIQRATQSSRRSDGMESHSNGIEQHSDGVKSLTTNLADSRDAMGQVDKVV